MTNCFGNNVRMYRESLNMSQTKFAEKVNSALRRHGKLFEYTNRSISKWENGDTMPSLDVVLAVSEMTGIGLDELFKDNVAEFKEQTSASEKKSFVFYDELTGVHYDDRYCFITEAIDNIYESGYTPHGMFYANTVILQKTLFPTESKGTFEDFAKKFREKPPKLFMGCEITDDDIMQAYTSMETLYTKQHAYGSEIVSLSYLMGIGSLKDNVADIMHDDRTFVYNRDRLVEGKPPFIDNVWPIDLKEHMIGTVYKRMIDRMRNNGLLSVAVNSSKFSAEHAKLKHLFEKECPNQLKARLRLFEKIPEFKEVNTAYFVYDDTVYAKHSIKIEMPTADYEKLYREYMSFIDNVPLVKKSTLYNFEDK